MSSLSHRYLLCAAAFLSVGAHQACGQTVVSRSVGDSDGGAFAVQYSNGELFYDGTIKEDGVAQLISLYRGLDEKPQTVAIRSTGGSTFAGIVLGKFIFARQLSVRVVDYCGSSCANYVFPAARKKSVTKDTVIWWHGSMSSKSWAIPGAADKHTCQSLDACGAELSAVAKERYRCKSTDSCEREKAELTAFFDFNFDALRKQEREFFASIGIDPAITVYGNDVAPCGCVWTFSIDDMRRFQIDNVVVEKGPRYPSDAAKKTLDEARNKVTLLKLP